MTYVPGVGFMNTRKSIQAIADEGRAKPGLIRRKVFVSYHRADEEEVRKFIEDFRDFFIFKCVGITENHDFIKSKDPEYIKSRIRTEILGDTSVTMVLVGTCTWSRHFVDWEISATLRDDKLNPLSALVGIALPHLGNTWKPPKRLSDNIVEKNPDASYAFGIVYPSDGYALSRVVEKALVNRDQHSSRKNNTRPLQEGNFACGQ